MESSANGGNLEMAFAAHLEAKQRDGKLGWFFDVYWADLGKDLDMVSGSFGAL